MLGLGIQRVVIAPVSNASVLTIVIMTIGLVLTFNGLASLIWSAEIRAFPSPFPNETWQIGDVSISQQDVGTFAIVLALVALLWAFFQFTKTGLALRASALNPEASRLVGVRVGWMLGDRLGPGRDARRGGRDARRPDHLPRSEHDAGDPDLRVRRCRARRHRLAVRRRRRAASCSVSG